MSKTNFEKQQKTFNNFISNFTTKGFRELTEEELFTVNDGKKTHLIWKRNEIVKHKSLFCDVSKKENKNIQRLYIKDASDYRSRQLKK